MAGPDRSYWSAWQARDRQAEATSAEWRRQRRAEAESAAEALVTELGVQRVVLFGSLASGTARPGSDVDLWVEGLPAEAYLAAVALVRARVTQAAVALVRARVTQADVDLVPAEWASPSLEERVAAEGVALHGRSYCQPIAAPRGGAGRRSDEDRASGGNLIRALEPG